MLSYRHRWQRSCTPVLFTPRQLTRRMLRVRQAHAFAWRGSTAALALSSRARGKRSSGALGFSDRVWSHKTLCSFADATSRAGFRAFVVADGDTATASSDTLELTEQNIEKVLDEVGGAPLCPQLLTASLLPGSCCSPYRTVRV